MQTHTQSTSFIVYINLWMPLLYGTPIPESSSRWPASACAALLPKLILHDPFTLFLKLSLVYEQVVGVNLPLSVRNICVY